MRSVIPSYFFWFQNPFLDGQDLSTMVGTDRASGSGLDVQNYARYQNRSGVRDFYNRGY